MNHSLKIILYFLFVALLSYFLYRDYTYEVSYNQSLLKHLFSANSSPYSIWWITLLIASIFLTIPLFYKEKIGFLGMTLLLITVAKPIVIKRHPYQSANNFLQVNQPTLQKMIIKLKEGRSISDKSLDEVGIQNAVYEPNSQSVIFTISSLNGNGHGLIYDEDEILPKNIHGETTFYQEIEHNWSSFQTR